MNRIFNEGIIFENQRFQESPLEMGDYEECTFINCDLSNTDLSSVNFIDCEFRGCNLSLVTLAQTSFREAKFRNCKLLGLHFEDCNNLTISLSFEDSSLELCSFNNLKLKNTLFRNSKVIEVDFTDTDLKNSTFHACDLQRSIFNNTILEGVDFRSSFNYSIDPDTNRIKKAKFSFPGILGLLDKFNIEID